MIRSVFNSLIERYYCHRFGREYIATHFNPDKLRRLGAKVGSQCRIYTSYYSSEPYLIEIGNHVTLTDGVSLITHDGAVWIFRESEPEIDLFGKILIGNNVFVGINATILNGTIIGDDSIIGAGSIVKGGFAPGSVIAGVPARRIASIQEYYEKNKPYFSYIRRLQGEDKMRAVIEHVKGRN